MGNSINNIKYLGRKFFGVRNLNTVVIYDVDAQNYFNANTAITSAADKNAINTFYLGLKSDGIYTKIKAMYLPIWGSAATSKWNLVNPLDTNAAFRLTFATGFTFSSSGMTPNGTSSYADTFLAPSTTLVQNSTHISYYSRTNTTGTEIEIGGATGPGTTDAGSLLEIRTVNTTYFRINSGTAYISYVDSDSRGFYIGNRTASNVINGWRNSTKVANGTTASNGLSTRSIWICGLNSGTTPFYSTKQCSFASIGTGLTDTEATNFYTRVNTLMTYFGINV